MRLLRVQVPEFRALKDVDISFEPDFTPQVFPLGSLNGGGKSTLLQLIFVLLNGTGFESLQFLKNLLKDFKISDSESTRIIAILDVDDNYKDNNKIQFQFKFFCCNEDYYKNNIESLNDERMFKFYPMGKISDDIYLICELQNESNTKRIVGRVINTLSKKIFLISPSNQPYLFLSREERRALFTVNNQSQYEQAVKNAQKELTNFFTFDFIDVLADVFNEAHAEDGRERIRTGRYGTNVEQLENSINSLFVDEKKIIPFIPEQERYRDITVQGFTFKLSSGEEIYPEDLSHGELKRLAIFVLIKHHKMQDAIVLMDEIENGFHPDWQYKIVRDLVEWGKNNQYILATHSYELCTAVTPAHVKELEPRLTKEAL